MSDITPEVVEAAKRRDGRIRLIGEHIAIDNEVRNSPTINYILRQITTNADRAMRELVATSPLDSVNIARLLVKIEARFYIQDELEDLKRRAEMAMHEVRLEDAELSEDE